MTHGAAMADEPNFSGARMHLICSVSAKRAYHSCSVIGNSFYIFGGLSDRKTVSSDMYRYDMSTNTWTLVEPKGPLSPASAIQTETRSRMRRSSSVFPGGWICQPPSLSHHSANVVREHFILIIGGWNGHKRTAEVYCFDTTEAVWYCIPVSGDVPAGLSSHTSVLVSTKEILIIGREGGVHTQRRFSGAFKLNFETGKYTEAPYHAASRSGHTANLINIRGSKETYLFIFGGRKSGGYELLGSLKKFYSQTSSFSNDKVVSLLEHCSVCEEPCGRRHSQVLELAHKYLLFYGGETWSGVRNNVTNATFILDTNRMLWYQVPITDQTPRLVGHSMCVIDQHIFVFGGMLENRATDTLWEMKLY